MKKKTEQKKARISVLVGSVLFFLIATGVVVISSESIANHFVSASTTSQVATQATDARDIYLTYQGKKILIPRKNISKSAVTVKKIRPVVTAPGVDPLYSLGEENTEVKLNSKKISPLLKKLSIKYEIKPVNAKLRIKNGRATAFALSRPGKEVDISRTIFNLEQAINRKEDTAELVMQKANPIVSENNLEALGIHKLIAKGTSTFFGSPRNRLHNIQVGARRFNGVLIKPGEIYSFNKTLGPVDQSTGYLKELVIGTNSTIPDYGGGLCQVSTTMFRAALNAGLPIHARSPHSYPVSYYTPFGTDATINLPAPDLKFKNDTGHYILVQTHYSYSRLTFEFYGTKLPRTVRYAGTKNGARVNRVELVTPRIWDNGVRGPRSFSTEFWRFVERNDGKLIRSDSFVSKYDSPDKYPHAN